MSKTVTRYCVNRWEALGIVKIEGIVNQHGALEFWRMRVDRRHHLATRKEAVAEVRKRARRALESCHKRAERIEARIKELE